MKAIVSKSSTCQGRNCPLYLVATFTVEVHVDSCFWSPREEYISILRWRWGAGRQDFPSSHWLNTSVISAWALTLTLYPEHRFEKCCLVELWLNQSTQLSLNAYYVLHTMPNAMVRKRYTSQGLHSQGCGSALQKFLKEELLLMEENTSIFPQSQAWGQDISIRPSGEMMRQKEMNPANCVSLLCLWLQTNHRAPWVQLIHLWNVYTMHNEDSSENEMG